MLYLQEAQRFLDRSPPSLIAVGGLSGTGKSVLAAALAPTLGNAPGAVHLRSDVVRKRLFGVDETTRLEERHYTAEVSRKVYDILLERAQTALQAGHSVVLDAVYQKAEEREEAKDLAASLEVDFHGLWLQADMEILINRVSRRFGDASDADAMVVKLQADRPIGPMRWSIVDAGGTMEQTLDRAWNAIAAPPVIHTEAEYRI